MIVSLYRGLSVAVLLGLVAAACGGAAAPTATPTKAPAPPAPAATATPAAAGAATPAATVRSLAPTPTASPAPTPTPRAGGPAGQITLVKASTTFKIDPRVYDSVDIQEPLFGMYNGLWEPDTTGVPKPVLLADWKVAPDNLTWEMRLRDGVAFSDGTPLTTKDVKYTFDTYTGLGASVYKRVIDRIEPVDRLSFKIVTKEPYPLLVNDFTIAAPVGWIMPEHYASKLDKREFDRKPMGSGPYKIVERSPGELDVYEALDSHWRQRGSVKRFIYRAVPEASTRLAMLRVGEADIAGLDAVQVQELKKDPRLRKVSSPALSHNFIALLDQGKAGSPMADVRVRQAINYAVDKQLILDKIFYGLGTIQNSLVSPWQFGYNTDLKPYPYDPAKAKQLLKDAGYEKGFEITLHAASVAQVPWITIVGDYLREVGIKNKTEIWEVGTYLERFRQHQLSGLGWMGSNTPGDSSFRYPTHTLCYEGAKGLYSYTCNKEHEALYNSQVAEMDQAKREVVLRQLAKMHQEQAYHLFMFILDINFGVSDRLNDWPQVGGMVGVVPMWGMSLKGR